MLAVLAGCGGGGSPVDDAARASDDAARAGSASSRGGLSGRRVVSGEEFIRKVAQPRVHKAWRTLEAGVRRLRAKGVGGNVRKEICTLVEVARSASPAEVVIGKAASKARRTRTSQYMAVSDEILAALDDGRDLDAFLAVACGL